MDTVYGLTGGNLITLTLVLLALGAFLAWGGPKVLAWSDRRKQGIRGGGWTETVRFAPWGHSRVYDFHIADIHSEEGILTVTLIADTHEFRSTQHTEENRHGN